MITLHHELERLSRDWIAHGLPTREKVISIAGYLSALKQQYTLSGLWSIPPKMLTTTLDDGFGQGIEIIQLFAKIVGLEVVPLGLLQKPEAIIAACQAHVPDYLGLSVLHLDSEDALAFVSRGVPQGTRLIAGGPAFRLDPDMASRCRVHATAANVAHFIKIMLQDARLEL